MPPGLRILHICSSLNTGGVTTLVKSIIELNDTFDSKHDLMLIFDDQKDDIDYNCKVYRLHINRKNILSILKNVKEIARQYDAIMFHKPHPVVVIPLLFTNNRYFIFQHGLSVSHGLYLKRLIKILWYSIIPILMNAEIVCSTEFAFQKSRDSGIFLMKKKSHVIPFGIAMARRLCNTGRQIKINDTITIGMAGRLAKVKRFDMVLKSLNSYSGNIKLSFLIAGHGPEEIFLHKLSEKVTNRNVKVAFLGKLDNMNTFYDRLDLFLFSSIRESFGLVVLEALFRSVPVALMSDSGGALKLVDDKKNGFVVESGVQGFETLWQYLNDYPEILQTQKKYILNMDLKEFEIENTRRELENLVLMRN